MHDVIYLCDRNHDQRKHAEEAHEAELERAAEKVLRERTKRRKMKRLETLKVVYTGSAMVAGGGATLSAIGIGMGSLNGVLVGIAVTLAGAISMWLAELLEVDTWER